MLYYRRRYLVEQHQRDHGISKQEIRRCHKPHTGYSQMVAFGFKIDIELCARTFQTNVHVVRSCIKKEGLKSPAFGRQYDILFGKNAWHKGNNIEVLEEPEDELFAVILQEYNKRKRGDGGGYDSDDIDFY